MHGNIYTQLQQRIYCISSFWITCSHLTLPRSSKKTAAIRLKKENQRGGLVYAANVENRHVSQPGVWNLLDLNDEQKVYVMIFVVYADVIAMEKDLPMYI